MVRIEKFFTAYTDLLTEVLKKLKPRIGFGKSLALIASMCGLIGFIPTVVTFSVNVIYGVLWTVGFFLYLILDLYFVLVSVNRR